jgi:putative ABC transport system permease protein
MSLPLFLAVKEIWHNKGRFLLISMVVALITTLVLFIAALAEGLGNGNREYIENLTGELLVYQAGVDLSASSSRIGRSRLNEIRRVEGVEDVGQVGFSNGTLVLGDGAEPLDVSLIGVEPGQPGDPPVVEGQELGRSRANEVVIDGNIAERTDVGVGDTITIKSIQGTSEEFFELEVIGISEGQSYFLQPSVIVPYLTWEKIRPQGANEGNGNGELVSNVVAVKLTDPSQEALMAERIEQQVGDTEVVDRVTAYEAAPGYSAQQSTLNTQRYFSFFIGILVLGGFFQIQTLQKVAQIGMLKAIGTSTWAIGLSAMLQIILINALGVVIGALGSLALGASFPPAVPIEFSRDALVTTVVSLMLIGPIGGLVSIIYLLRIEPLTALGLAQ